MNSHNAGHGAIMIRDLLRGSVLFFERVCAHIAIVKQVALTERRRMAVCLGRRAIRLITVVDPGQSVPL